MKHFFISIFSIRSGWCRETCLLYQSVRLPVWPSPSHSIVSLSVCPFFSCWPALSKKKKKKKKKKKEKSENCDAVKFCFWDYRLHHPQQMFDPYAHLIQIRKNQFEAWSKSQIITLKIDPTEKPELLLTPCVGQKIRAVNMYKLGTDLSLVWMVEQDGKGDKESPWL